MAPLIIIKGLRPQPIGEQAGKERGNHAPQKHGSDNNRKLAGVEPGSCLQVGQCAADDPHIHSIEQPTKPGYQEQKAVVRASLTQIGGCLH